MNLHEYQSKPLFAEYGIPVTRGIPVKEMPEQIFTVAIAPDAGLQDFQARQLAFGLGLNSKQTRLYRQPKLVELRDITQEDDKKREAAANDLNLAAQG